MSSDFYKKGGVIINKLFIAEVKKHLTIKSMSYKELAIATGYKHKTIQAFMCGIRDGKRMTNAIADVLGIKI